MCICEFMCIHVSGSVYARVCLNRCIHVCTHADTLIQESTLLPNEAVVCIYRIKATHVDGTRTRICIHTCITIYACRCIHMCVHLCIHVFISQLHMRAYLLTYVYIYVPTRTACETHSGTAIRHSHSLAFITSQPTYRE